MRPRGRAAAAAASGSAADDPVAGFLQHLSNHGFAVGPRDLIRAHELLLILAVREDAPGSFADRLALLQPLLCRSPEQQRGFAALLTRWLATTKLEGGARFDANQLPADAERRRRWPWLAGAALGAVALIGALLLPPRWHRRDAGTSTAGIAASQPAVTPALAPGLPALPATAPPTLGELPLTAPRPHALATLAENAVDRAGIVAAALLTLLLLGYGLRRVALQPLRTDIALEQRTLFGERAQLLPKAGALLRLVSRELRRPRQTERLELDLAATIAATVRRGGAFVARHRARRSTPEYLVLVDRRGVHDQLARIAQEIAAALDQQGVSLDAYALAGSGGQCEPLRLTAGVVARAPGAARRTRLADLAARSAGQRLLMFVDAAALLDPLTGDLRSGFEAATGFDAAVLFTPLPVAAWGAAEAWLAKRDVLVLPMQMLALATAADWLGSQRALLAIDPDWPTTYPPRLRDRPALWVAGVVAPPADEIDGLLFELGLYLGPRRLQWLCACAAFPGPAWPVTLALGRALLGPQDDLVTGAVALAALPWFREGAWPLWLRQALQSRLAPEHERTVSAQIRERLRAASLGRDPGAGDALADVATEPGLRTRLRDWWQRFAVDSWVRGRPGRLPRDVLFLGFIQRGLSKRLTQVVPERLRRLLFRDGLPLLGMQRWVLAFGAVAVAAGLLLQIPAVRAWSVAKVAPQVLPSVPRVALMKGHTKLIFHVEFSADGKLIVSASADGSARLWRRDGTLIAVLLEHNIVQDAAISPDSRRVATASIDHSVRLWNRDGTPSGVTVSHALSVESVRFSPDGSRIVTASRDETARIWEVATGAPIGAAMAHGSPVKAASFSPDGLRVLTLSEDGSARIWDAWSGVAAGEPVHGEGVFNSARFSPDGRRVVTGSDRDIAVIWDVATRRPVGVPMRHGAGVTSAQFSPDGTRVVTASNDKTARLWDSATGRPLSEPLLHGSWVGNALFSPDGRRVLTTSDDGTVRLWSALDGAPVALLSGKRVFGVAFSPDGRQLVTGADDGMLTLWGEAVAPRAEGAAPAASAASDAVSGAAQVAFAAAQAASSTASASAAASAARWPVPQQVPVAAARMPDVLGLPAKSALDALKGFKVATTEEDNAAICSGTVISQQPAAGTSLAASDAVALRVVGKGIQGTYPMVCRGGMDEPLVSPESAAGLVGLQFDVLAGESPAAAGLRPGQCTWLDRAFRPGEPLALRGDVAASRLTLWRQTARDASRYFRVAAVNRGKYFQIGCVEAAAAPGPALPASGSESAAASAPASRQPLEAKPRRP